MTDTIVETGVSAEVAGDVASAWVEAFAASMLAGDVAAVGALFLAEGWWRDHLALSWDIRTVCGRSRIERLLADHLAGARLIDLRLSSEFEPRYRKTRIGGWIELIFEYEAVQHRGRGVAFLVEDADGAWRAWTLLTSMHDLVGHEETVTTLEGMRGGEYRDPKPGRRRWFEQRLDAVEFADRDPDVLVVGAGHAGLGLAARLARLGLDALVVDRFDRVGDNWRTRYANLQLHDPYFANHLPYLKFPETTNWSPMLPKDKLADWLEMYARVMDINVWPGTEVTAGHYDEDAGRWSMTLRREGDEQVVQCRHVVLATGLYRIPWLPDLSGIDRFTGEVLHSSAFSDGKNYAGKRAIVVGTGASAFDIAQDLCEQGADTTIVQRSTTYVMSTEHGVYSLFERYRSRDRLEDIDLLAAAMPLPLAIHMDQEHVVPALAELDRELLEGLEAAGFRTNRRGALSSSLAVDHGAYYFDQGGCQLVIDGRVGVKRGTAAGFTEDELVFEDGTRLPADLVVLATGWENMRESARPIFGDDVADRCSEVWGLDDERNELRSIWRASGQPQLWFHSGGLSHGRYYSRLLALQIKAHEVGIL